MTDEGEKCNRCNRKAQVDKYYCYECEIFGNDEFEKCTHCQAMHFKDEGDLCNDCKVEGFLLQEPDEW